MDTKHGNRIVGLDCEYRQPYLKRVESLKEAALPPGTNKKGVVGSRTFFEFASKERPLMGVSRKVKEKS